MQQILRAFIDGRALPERVFQTLVAKNSGNVYYSTPGARYGIKVQGNDLPNGVNSEIRIGKSIEDSIVIPLTTVDDPTRTSVRRGSVNVLINGEKMVAEGYINALSDGNFTLKISVHRPSGSGGKKAASIW